MKKLFSAFLIFTFAFSSVIPLAKTEETVDPHAVMDKDFNRYLGDDVVTTFEMRLVNKDGKVRRRDCLRYQKKINGLKKDLLKFSYPDDIRDTATFTDEVKGADDIQYLYLPAAKKLRRISGKNQSWVGSDLSYEDLQQVELDDWNYKYLRSEPIDGADTYVIEMIPTSSDKSIYGKEIRWVKKEIYTTIKVEYYDKEGNLWKQGFMHDIREIKGAYYAWHMIMEDVKDSHKTEIVRHLLMLNTGMPDELVTTREAEKSIESYDYPKGLWNMWEEAKKNVQTAAHS